MVIEQKGQFFSLLEVALAQLDEDEARNLWYDVIDNLGLKDRLKVLSIDAYSIPVGDIDLLINYTREFSIPILLNSDIWHRVFNSVGMTITTITGSNDDQRNQVSHSIGEVIKAIFISAPKTLFSKIYKLIMILCALEAILYSVLILTDSEHMVHFVVKIVFHIIGLYMIFQAAILSIGLFPFLILFVLSRFFMKPNIFAKFMFVLRVFLIVLLLLSPITFYLIDFIYSPTVIVKLYIFIATIGFILGGLSSIKNYEKQLLN